MITCVVRSSSYCLMHAHNQTSREHLPATARGIRKKTSENRLGVKRFHFMCIPEDLKWKIGGRVEKISVGRAGR